MRAQLDRVLSDKAIDLWWAYEAHGRPKREGWVGVADVGCSRTVGAVYVPRRRFSAYHVAEVLHEVAHLERWRWLAKSPSRDSDLAVCQLAVDIAMEYGFEEPVLEWLYKELAERLSEEVEGKTETARKA